MRFQRISRFGFVNCYLVEDDGGITVIDTMIGGSAPRILDAAKGLGGPITRIVLTHGHSDHTGSLDELHDRAPHAEVISSTREARLMAGDKSLDAGEPEDKVRGGWPKLETQPDRTVEPGERIGSLEVLAAPGHTPGQIALLDTREGTLFCADAYATLGGMATSAKANPLFPLPAMATWHRPTALETARRLAAGRPRRLAPGHGKVVEDPVRAMELACEKAEG